MRQSLFVSFTIAFLSPLIAQDKKVEWWQQDFDSALAASEEASAKMMLLYFWRDPNDACTSMYGGTLSDEKVVPVLGEFVCMGAQGDTDAGSPLFEKYKIGQVPTVLFVKPDGSVVDVVAGYVPVADFLTEVERIKSGKDTLGPLREAAAATPDDFELQLRLVRKLRAAGDKPGSLEVIEAIVAKDPKGKNEFAAEAMLMKINDEVFVPGVSPKDYDLEPLRAFLARQKNKRIRFLGYDRMAAAEHRREDLKAAAKYAKRAWKDIPKKEVQEWGQNIARLAYKHRKELDKSQLKLALEISKKALSEVEKQHKKKPDKPFYAYSLFLHASMLNVNNKRKDAFAMMDEAIEIDPDNKTWKDFKKRWMSGEK